MVVVLSIWAVSLAAYPPPKSAGEGMDVPAYARMFLPLAAAAWALFRSGAAFARRPVPRLAETLVALSLGLGALVAYYDGIHFGYGRFVHRHEQYHLYLSSKYFPELGYTRLYRCTIVAESELAPFESTEEGQKVRIDPRADVRLPTRAIRDLESPSGDAAPAQSALDSPEKCTSHFSAERWSAFKEDVRFFRGITRDADYWFGMQLDQGAPRTPVWHFGARLIASRGPPSIDSLETLAWLDVVLVLGMFGAVAWAFGVRVAGFGAVIWGCQAIAPWFWTGGGFLETEWIAALVIASCLARKRKVVPAGIVMAYAVLLSPFTLLIALGWVAVIGLAWLRRRALSPDHRRVALGAGIGLVAFLALGSIPAGPSAYVAYADRARITTSRALTNDMGFDAALSHDFGGGPGSGRMEFAQDSGTMDSFARWRWMRGARLARFAPVHWVVVAAVLASLAYALRRTRLVWIGGSLAQVLVVAAMKVVSWNYAFLVLSAPLTRGRGWLEVPIAGFLTLSQIIYVREAFNDDRYATLSLVALALSWGLVVVVTPLRRKAGSG